MEISSFSNDILGEILKNVPLRDLLLLGRTNRHWRQVSHNVLSSTRFCLCYRLTNENSQPATLYLEGHHCEVEKSTKIYRLDEFGKSSLISGVERLSIYYPIVLPDFSVGALPNSLFELQSKLLNLKHIEFTGNDVNVFYAPIGRPTLRTMFPQLSQIVVFCNFPEFKLRMEFNRKSGFLPSVKLDCMEKFHTTLVRAFTKVDQFIEAVRAEGLVNQEKFNNTLAMKDFSLLMPISSLTFDTATELRGSSVLSTVTELRLIVSEHQNLTATLTHLPQLKVLELDDERRCTCIVRLPLMRDLISLTLAVHSCALDRNLLTQSPNLKQLHIYSEECGAVWLELLALNLIHLPELTTLILNCWDDGQMSCPCEIDDVVVYIVKGIIKLRTLILGPGVQPTLTGLRRIIKRSNLHTIDAYLCASIDSSESTIAELIKMTSGSCVKILRTKIPVLSRTIEETLQNFLKTAYSNENVAEGIWESENDFVIKSTIVNDLTLFRIRKVELTRPINSLKQLTNKFSCKVDSTKCKCEIPQLCDSEGPSFTCGGCARPPEVLKCRPQRCVNEDKGCQGLTHKCNNRSSCSFKGLKSRLVKCMADCIDLDNLGKKLEIPGKALWLSWNDTELQKHFSQFASHKASRRSSRMCHTDTHWILFLSAD